MISNLIFFLISFAVAEPLKINFQINQHDRSLNKIFHGENSSSLCFPSALAHRLYYLKYSGEKAFPNLKLQDSPIANVEKFVNYCKTSQNGGTTQKQKIPCIEKAFTEASYKINAYSIGEDSETQKRPVTSKDLISAAAKGQSIILHIAWWKQDTKTKKWAEHGSHSVNAYDVFTDEKTKQVKLRIVDPGVDYLKYHPDRMYDEVTLIAKDPALPTISQVEIESGRFNRNGRKAVLKNIYVFGKL